MTVKKAFIISLLFNALVMCTMCYMCVKICKLNDRVGVVENKTKSNSVYIRDAMLSGTCSMTSHEYKYGKLLELQMSLNFLFNELTQKSVPSSYFILNDSTLKRLKQIEGY